MTISVWLKFLCNSIAYATALLLSNNTVASAQETLPSAADLMLPHQLPQPQPANPKYIGDQT